MPRRQRPKNDEHTQYFGGFNENGEIRLQPPPKAPPTWDQRYQQISDVSAKLGMNLHGIQTELSDIRAHVSPLEQLIYMFETKDALETIQKDSKIRWIPAHQPGVAQPTAIGFIVKPEMLSTMKKLVFPEWASWAAWNNGWDTSQKGRFAEKCVNDLISLQPEILPVRVTVEHIRDKTRQIAGMDVIVTYGAQKVQIKCDSRIADTHNLFIQVAESNPKKMR